MDISITISGVLFALALPLAVVAVVRGIMALRAVKKFENPRRRDRMAFLALSIVHLAAGFLILLFYAIIVALVLLVGTRV